MYTYLLYLSWMYLIFKVVQNPTKYLKTSIQYLWCKWITDMTEKKDREVAITHTFDIFTQWNIIIL
jgi:hypothetical protein